MQRLEGLLAATCTPFHSDGTLNLDVVPAIIRHLINRGVRGIYIGGSTGEGPSLTTEERKRLAEAYVESARGQLRTIVHVGHNSLADARDLARHAESIGADVVSATAPNYFKITETKMLVESMAEIAGGASSLPFYYYHIPKFSHADIDMVEFLQRADGRLENLAGVKYTATTVHEFQACQELYEKRFDMVWGCDEMLLSALAVGARSAIGSTYNVAAPLYNQIIGAFGDKHLERAMQLQHQAVQLIRLLSRYPFLASVKYLLELGDIFCGPCRNPVPNLSDEQKRRLQDELAESELLKWVSQ